MVMSTKSDLPGDVAEVVAVVVVEEMVVSAIASHGIASWMTGKETGQRLGMIGVVTVAGDMTTWVLREADGMIGITMDMDHRAGLRMID